MEVGAESEQSDEAANDALKEVGTFLRRMTRAWNSRAVWQDRATRRSRPSRSERVEIE